MTVQLDGNVRMRGDTGPGVAVTVIAGEGRIRIMTGSELVGDWELANLGFHALNQGFAVRAEGEEFVLRTEDDAALADELRLTAVTPRLARQVAARHKPEDRMGDYQEPEPIASNLAAIGFAVAGALVILGGTFLNISPATLGLTPQTESGSDFWLAFVIGGVLMVGAGFVMSIGSRLARTIALGVLLAMIVAFVLAVRGFDADTGTLTAYGFIAGGLVVGVAVLFSGSLRRPE
jgi:hypothetical protein